MKRLKPPWEWLIGTAGRYVDQTVAYAVCDAAAFTNPDGIIDAAALDAEADRVAADCPYLVAEPGEGDAPPPTAPAPPLVSARYLRPRPLSDAELREKYRIR